MDLNTLMVLTQAGMLAAIFAGVHIALALGMTAMIGTWIIFGDLYLASAQVGGAAYEPVGHYVFATIPLFVLMGDFVAKCGAAGDLYKVIDRGLRGIPGRLAVATVGGNSRGDGPDRAHDEPGDAEEAAGGRAADRRRGGQGP